MLQAWFMRRISCGPPLRGVAGEVGDESDGTPSSFPGVACLCANPEMKEYAVKTSTPPAPARPRRACARVAWAALVLLSPPALAVPFATSPVLLSPNGASNAAVDLGTRPAVNGYSLSSQYYDPAIDDNRVSNSGAVYAPGPAGLTFGIGPNGTSSVTANPGAFDVTTKSSTYSPGGGEHNFAYGAAQTWNWLVLTGAPGTVTLSVDVLMRGRLFANNDPGGYAVAIFGQSLGFLSSPADTTLDYVMVFNGTIGWGGGLVRNNTVTVANTTTTAGVGTYVYWDTSNAVQEINYILRSQPFTVTVGTPFRLSLLSSTQTFAGEPDDPLGTTSSAWADFSDPSLVTSIDFGDVFGLTPSGFSVVLGNGQYADPEALGLSIRDMPEPAVPLLLLAGLAGLWFARRGGRRRALGGG